MATVRPTALYPAAATVLDDPAEQSTGAPARTKRKRDPITGIDGKEETTAQGGGRFKRTQPHRAGGGVIGEAEGCPWTDAVEARVVWALVVECMLAEVASLDRSGFGDGAQKKCWRMARALALLGSVCRVLYDYVGGLGVRFDMLAAADSEGTGSSECPASTRLLWCTLRRNSTPPSWDVLDTDGNLYHRMSRLVWCEMRSGHLCAPRASGAPPPAASTPAETDGSGRTAPNQRCTEDSDRDGTEDERQGVDDAADDDDDGYSECESDTKSDTDDNEPPTGPYRSRVELPHYRDTWDDIKWENENEEDEIKDDDEEDYEDSHQDEEGTLRESGTPHGEWTLTIFNHYHNGLILTGAKVEP
ncbi:hypothetical protein [Pandoravirus japonicus]|uniref:Uncharacterized protein n=1 Tax=Pandoravirus japonicus TaxID=2823154 RepID=A0A811BPZ0_9VIRU|nr:hypothetical protein [Pandoravirus japonicus]